MSSSPEPQSPQFNAAESEPLSNFYTYRYTNGASLAENAPVPKYNIPHLSPSMLLEDAGSHYYEELIEESLPSRHDYRELYHKKLAIVDLPDKPYFDSLPSHGMLGSVSYNGSIYEFSHARPSYINTRQGATFEQPQQLVERPSPLHDSLVAGFEGMVATMSLANVAMSNAESPIKHLERFRLVPISATDTHPWNYSAGRTITMPSGVVCTYTLEKPYIDAGYAIGLTYRHKSTDPERLAAVAAARIDPDGVLTVIQLQDVTKVSKFIEVFQDPEAASGVGLPKRTNPAYYRTGLQSGMAWRQTLVRAWEVIGEQIGVTAIAVQSNKNNRWPAVQEAHGHGYDNVAQTMGYIFDPITRNWVRPEVADKGDQAA